MTKFTKFDVPALTLARNTLVEDFAAAAAKLGLTVQLGRLTSDGGLTASMKVTLTIQQTDTTTGLTISPEVVAWNTHCERFGLKKEWLGAEVETGQRDKAKIVGLRPEKRSNCVLIQTKSGKRYIFSADNVIRQLAAAIVTGLTAELKSKFLNLACALSPENLFADGERTRAQAANRKKQIEAEWAKLEAQAGRRVSLVEAEGFPFVSPFRKVA